MTYILYERQFGQKLSTRLVTLSFTSVQNIVLPTKFFGMLDWVLDAWAYVL